MNTVTIQKRRKVAVKVLYYVCKECCKTPLLHPADREKGVCERCKLKKRQAKRRREYMVSKALGDKWTNNKLTNKDIDANIERVVRQAQRKEKAGTAADLHNIAPSPLFLQARRARKVG